MFKNKTCHESNECNKSKKSFYFRGKTKFKKHPGFELESLCLHTYSTVRGTSGGVMVSKVD